MLSGAGVAGLARYTVILLIWGTVSFALALRLFRWQ